MFPSILYLSCGCTVEVIRPFWPVVNVMECKEGHTEANKPDLERLMSGGVK